MQKLASIGLVAEGAGAAPLIPAVEGRAGEGKYRVRGFWKEH